MSRSIRQVDQGHEFVEDVLNNVERFLAAKVAALRRNESANLDNVDVPTGGLALDFAKHTDPEVELKRLKAARGVKDIVYIRSRSRVTAAPGSNPFKRLVSGCSNASSNAQPGRCFVRQDSRRGSTL